MSPDTLEVFKKVDKFIGRQMAFNGAVGAVITEMIGQMIRMEMGEKLEAKQLAGDVYALVKAFQKLNELKPEQPNKPHKTLPPSLKLLIDNTKMGPKDAN